jgi:hypothetical protein
VRHIQKQNPIDNAKAGFEILRVELPWLSYLQLSEQELEDMFVLKLLGVIFMSLEYQRVTNNIKLSEYLLVVSLSWPASPRNFWREEYLSGTNLSYEHLAILQDEGSRYLHGVHSQISACNSRVLYRKHLHFPAVGSDPDQPACKTQIFKLAEDQWPETDVLACSYNPFASLLLIQPLIRTHSVYSFFLDLQYPWAYLGIVEGALPTLPGRVEEVSSLLYPLLIGQLDLII